jgi:Septum formation
VRKRWTILIFVVALLGVVGGAYWLTRPASAGISATPPKAAPATGSCWLVDEKAAASAFPWPGKPVDCAARHTAEVFFVGQVDRELAARAATAKGEDAKLQQNLMYAQARRACIVHGSDFVGGDWHSARVQIIAGWIKPARSGHFGCAIVEATAPASKQFVARTASLRGAASALPIACVARTGGALAYAGCDTSHDGEFVGTYTITPMDLPFDAQKVPASATTGCGNAMTSYVGAARTDLRAGYVGPTSGADWLGSDQTYACYALASGADKLRGSVKGIGSGPLPR